MPDYIYLLENRLSPSQQSALKLIRDAARDAQMTVFLTGGAVRDLTSGSPVRDLDVSVQGNALKLQKAIEKAGGVFWGSDTPSQTLFFRFPGGARAEVSSTRRVEYPKPGKPVYHWDNILDDLHRRDFTANAMALSLNEGSYGLLMDPLNGVADIEARQLRLVSNYGFLEEPARLIRATRFAARLGWELDDKTRVRFDNAIVENVIESLSPWQRAYELEEIGHEEDALKILKAMESAGWMKYLFPAWTAAKADVAALEQLREVLTQLQMQGVNPDISAASMELLTAKMAPKEIAAMKAMFVRPGFVEEWNTLDARAKEFGKALTSKQASTPSSIWKLFTTWNPDAVLWLGLTGKNAAIQEKYKNFFSVWPEARQKIPYTIMQEMRIVPELPGYQDLLQSLFYEFIDGKLQTEEELKAFLEPFSPPAPPPPVTVRRARSPKKSAEGRGKSKVKEISSDDGEDADEDEVELPDAEALDSTEDEPVEDDTEDDDEDEPKKPASKAKSEKTKSANSEKAPSLGLADGLAEKSPSKAQPGKHSKVLDAVNGSAVAASAPGKGGKQPGKDTALAKPAASAKAELVKAAPVKAAPVKATPVKATPVKAAPVKAALVKATAAKSRPEAKKPVVPATKHVAKKAAVKSAGTRKAPAGKKVVAKKIAKAIKPAAKKLAIKKHSVKKAGTRKPIAAKKSAAKVVTKNVIARPVSKKPLARQVPKPSPKKLQGKKKPVAKKKR